MGDEEGILIMERSFMSYLKDNDALESTYLEEQYLEEELLPQGNYKLIGSMLDVKGDQIQKNAIVVAKTNLKPISRILGVDVFQVQVAHTGKILVVSREDVTPL
jgi:hypothetical protein